MKCSCILLTYILDYLSITSKLFYYVNLYYEESMIFLLNLHACFDSLTPQHNFGLQYFQGIYNILMFQLISNSFALIYNKKFCLYIGYIISLPTCIAGFY